MNKLFRKFLLASVIQNLWWRFVPGTTITVKWPNGWVLLHDDGLGGQIHTESADPNDHYRPDLEKLVGRQGWDWNWGCAGAGTIDSTISIKFRSGRAEHASYFSLRWS